MSHVNGTIAPPVW